MKYFLVAGEASGDLHGSNLMRELKLLDPEAEFRYFGGDLMASMGGTLLKHYREMAFMGFVAVLLNARTILRNMALCKAEIAEWKPDVLILIDYASFNLKIAAYVKKTLPDLPVHFYISPKIWAWKEYRIKSFKKYIDHMYVILPFETEFFAKHDFPVSYVGNPSVDSVSAFMEQPFDEIAYRRKHGLDQRRVLVMLPGSRKSEIRGNLPLMVKVANQYPNVQLVVAGAPGQPLSLYDPYLLHGERLVFGETYSMLRIAHAAIVTSGTATLETALIGAPQVVSYAVGGGSLPNWIFRHFMHVPYFSLVNLIAGRPVVNELMGSMLNTVNLTTALDPLMKNTPERQAVLDGYAEIREKLGQPGAAQKTAELILLSMTKNA
jgi:lipid-A-disaccharide synthase